MEGFEKELARGQRVIEELVVMVVGVVADSVRVAKLEKVRVQIGEVEIVWVPEFEEPKVFEATELQDL